MKRLLCWTKQSSRYFLSLHKVSCVSWSSSHSATLLQDAPTSVLLLFLTLCSFVCTVRLMSCALHYCTEVYSSVLHSVTTGVWQSKLYMLALTVTPCVLLTVLYNRYSLIETVLCTAQCCTMLHMCSIVQYWAVDIVWIAQSWVKLAIFCAEPYSVHKAFI